MSITTQKPLRTVAVQFLEVPRQYGLNVLATAPNVVSREIQGRNVEMASSSSGALVVHIDGEGFFRLADEDTLVQNLITILESKPAQRTGEGGC